MLWYIYYNQRLWVISFIAWNVFTIRLLYFPHVTTFDLFLPITVTTFDLLVHFGTWLIAKLFHSVHKKLWTCGADFKYYEVADLQLRTSRFTKLRTCGCGLAVADFKNYEVADLRLRIQESWKVVADLRLRTKLLNVQLRTCGCGLRKLKFGCGFADCGLKKKTCGAQHCI